MEKQFTKGFYFKKHEKAPSFVVGQLSIKVPDAIPFLEENQSNAGYVNIDIKLSKNGTYYCELNTWKPTKDTASEDQSNQEKLNNETVEYPEDTINPEDIPF